MKVEPLGLAATEAAAFVGVSRSFWWKAHSAGKIPAPVRVGSKALWRRDELTAWMHAGCPPRDKWAVLWADLKKSCAIGG